MVHGPGAFWKCALLVVSLGLLTVGASAELCQAETYAFDKKSTEVRFTYQLALVPQSGRFTEVDGLVEFNERAPERSRVDASINAVSLIAGDPLVEKELNGESFFNVALQPRIRFASQTVTATAKNCAELAGELTMNGITRPVTLQVVFYPKGTLLPGNVRQGEAEPFFIARARIKRSSFNMTAYELIVADEIEIQIAAQLRKNGARKRQEG
jgi:polyisoprenoid-binding protein YceI